MHNWRNLESLTRNRHLIPERRIPWRENRIGAQLKISALNAGFIKRAGEIQRFGTVNHLLPLELKEPVRLEMTSQLNQLLADTMTIRDLYKKSHWQIAGPTFYQL